MASNLPDYVASAKPVPPANRMPWYKSTAQTYAGIMLWFVFWESVPSQRRVGTGGHPGPGRRRRRVLGVIVAALICHFASYLAPGMMGMKTGLPLAVVGTSTYGVQGGFLMPGFFMGVLQFGWLAVNAYFSAELLAGLAGHGEGSPLHLAIGVVWAIVAAFVGLKGIQYVAKVATFLPLIPLVILLVLAGKTLSAGRRLQARDADGGRRWRPSSWTCSCSPLPTSSGSSPRPEPPGPISLRATATTKDVQLGGLVGVAGATIFTGCLALLIVAGTYGAGLMEGKDVIVNPTKLMETIMGGKVAKIFWLLLAIAAFPPACFSSLIAANSLKNTLPKVNPFISVGIGTAASIALVLSGQAGNAAADVRHHRRFVRPDLRRDDRRLSAGRLQVARTAGRVQSGRLDLLGRRLRGRRHRHARGQGARHAGLPWTCLARRWRRSSSASCCT